MLAVGLQRILEAGAQVHVGHEPPKHRKPSSIVYCTDGIEGLSDGVKGVRRIFPDASLLVFGVHEDLTLARAALEAGARGFVHAGLEPGQLVRAVKVAAEGELVAPRSLLEYLLFYDDAHNGGGARYQALSARQREVLELVAQGMSNAEVAERLYLSESTVKQHLRAVYKLLGVSNRTEEIGRAHV